MEAKQIYTTVQPPKRRQIWEQYEIELFCCLWWVCSLYEVI